MAEHGSKTAYSKGCRCEVCKYNHARYQNKRNRIRSHKAERYDKINELYWNAVGQGWSQELFYLQVGAIVDTQIEDLEDIKWS